MVYIDGCRLMNGCTVLLRDAPDYKRLNADEESRKLLTKIKSIFLFLLRILYHCKLEVSNHVSVLPIVRGNFILSIKVFKF